MSDQQSETAGRGLTSKEQKIMHAALRRSVRMLCESCGKFTRDPPSHLCPGCEALSRAYTMTKTAAASVRWGCDEMDAELEEHAKNACPRPNWGRTQKRRPDRSERRWVGSDSWLVRLDWFLEVG